MKKILLLTPLLISLAACGGGGTNTSGTDNPNLTQAPDTTPETVTTPTEPTSDSELINTNEITSNDEFQFKSSWEMNIKIDIVYASHAMVSICSGYNEKDDGTFDIDYSTCSIQATLNRDGFLSDKLNITNEVQSLAGVIWFTDQTTPLYKSFVITNGQENLNWN